MQGAVILGVEDIVPIRVLVTVIPLAVSVTVLLARVGLPRAVVPGALLSVAVQLLVRPAVSICILTNERTVFRSRDLC